jgi:Flp pilus assembly protein TadG
MLARVFRAQGQLGVAAVETAITIPIFLMIIFVGIDLLRVTYTANALQYGVSKGARFASVMLHNGGSLQEQSIVDEISRTSRLPLQLETDIKICPAPQTTCAISNAGQPHEFVAVTARYQVAALFGAFQIPLLASVVTRNEPF